MEIQSELEIALLQEQVEDMLADWRVMEQALASSKAYLEAIPANLRGPYWKETYNVVCEALGID